MFRKAVKWSHFGALVRKEGKIASVVRLAGCRATGDHETGLSAKKNATTECLGFTSAAPLEYCTREYLEWYNHERPHRELGGQIIHPRPQDTDGEIVEFSRLGGLLKSYRRVKLAA